MDASNAHVNHALRRLHHEIAKGEIKSPALPRLATGVGGLDWADIRPLIQQHFSDLNIPVYVNIHYIKGQSAEES